MEIPDNLIHLYSHWQKHTIKPSIGKSNIPINKKVLEDMISFADERNHIWEKKQKGFSSLTDDPILKKYRFCNIYRELDKETIATHELLKPLKNNFNLWLLNLVFCRMVCKTETIKQVGLLSLDHESNLQVYNKLTLLPRPKYGTAYVFPISIILRSNYPTREKFFCFYLPKVVCKLGSEIKSFRDLSVCQALEATIPIFGFNFKFHLTEVLIDISYQYPHFIDLYKDFPIGPGSLPTMKQVSSNTDPKITCMNLMARQPYGDFQYLTLNGKKVYLSAENIEGIGCEFRKYSNLKKGEGRKRIFHE